MPKSRNNAGLEALRRKPRTREKPGQKMKKMSIWDEKDRPPPKPTMETKQDAVPDYVKLGLSEIPNKGDNGVHASASPFEGLAEKSNWLKRSLTDDAFGKALLDAGLSKETIVEWSVDPQVIQPGGGKGSVFDALEDMDAEACLAKLMELNDLNSNTI